jgi:asparaginyl-tRNA synthetase
MRQIPGLTRIKTLLHSETPMQGVVVRGWVRTRRDSKTFSFLEVNDGSCRANLQIVADHADVAPELLARANVGASVEIAGDLIASQGKGQRWELKAGSMVLIGEADAEAYPLQKKRHTDEFLRSIAHLRPRSNKYGALFRIRSELSFAVHEYFRSRGFLHLHAPILTGSDCEGAGEMFRVTTLDPTKPLPKAAPGESPFAEDFFGKPANLTVSGQLSAEVAALSHTDCYTFGPTFRAENSNTPKHAAEFWMIEPEMAFADLSDDMDLAEDCLSWLTRTALERCGDDLEIFAQFVDQSLPATWKALADGNFARMPYAEAVEVLRASGKSFEYEPAFGKDLQTEHERYLAEEHCKRPVIVFDYPREIKAFYMRLNDDERTVAAMDLLTPRVGELVGGSQREERLDVLERRMAEQNLPTDCYWWYLELRKFGSAPHAGFGMGFERLLMLLTGVANIRDVIPFPRTPKHLEF